MPCSSVQSDGLLLPLSVPLAEYGEDLEALWQKLQLTEEEEEEGVVVPKEVYFEGSSWLPNCLLGCLLTKKGFN